MTSSLVTTRWGRVPSAHGTCYPALAWLIQFRACAMPSVPVPPITLLTDMVTRSRLLAAHDLTSCLSVRTQPLTATGAPSQTSAMPCHGRRDGAVCATATPSRVRVAVATCYACSSVGDRRRGRLLHSLLFGHGMATNECLGSCAPVVFCFGTEPLMCIIVLLCHFAEHTPPSSSPHVAFATRNSTQTRLSKPAMLQVRVAFCACACAVCAALRQKDRQKCCCAADHIFVPACRRHHTRPRRSDVAILTVFASSRLE